MSISVTVILGPTASGKTSLGVAAARALNGEIISADSRQVYRGMDLGTGKDLAEYGNIPYHLIDICAPQEDYHLFAFQQDCYRCLQEVQERGRHPLLVGGSGLYLAAVIQHYQLAQAPLDPQQRQQWQQLTTQQLQEKLLALKPQQHNTTDLADRQRLLRALEIASAPATRVPPQPQLEPLVFGVSWPPKLLRQRIHQRLRERLQQGLVTEVKQLHAEGLSWQRLESFGLEYRYLAAYLQGHYPDINSMEAELAQAITKFAKRQRSWFRRMQRQGVTIHWLDPQNQPLETLLQHWQHHHGQLD